MNIAVISTLGGGVGRVTNYLIRGLISRSDVSIDLYQVDRRTEFMIEDDYHLRKFYTPSIGASLFAHAESIFDLSLKPMKYDLVHCHYSSNAAFLRRSRSPIVLTMHGFPRPEVETKFADRLAYHLEQWSVNHLPTNLALVTVSKYARNSIKQRYGLEATVIYNGIDCNFFVPATDKERIKIRLGLKDKKIILFVGRLHPLKDPMTLIRAYHQVSKKLTNSVLIIVGTGILKTELINFSNKNGLTTIFKDNVYGNDLLSLYQIADIFVLPSLGDSLATVLAEAMACKCPCIANNSGSNSELLGMNELLIEAGDQKALCERIEYLFENPIYSERVSSRLYERARKVFSMETMTKDYYEFYQSVLKK